MADNEIVVVETTTAKKSILRENLMALSEPDNFQKYILGTKKNGEPRALYDVLRDCTDIGKKSKKKKKKKGKKNKNYNSYSFYLDTKGKKKKKKKKKGYWHI